MKCPGLNVDARLLSDNIAGIRLYWMLLKTCGSIRPITCNNDWIAIMLIQGLTNQMSCIFVRCSKL